MGHGRYILDEHRRVIREHDLITWAMWLETADRLVRRDADEAAGWVVSTVFLGLDHQWGEGPPLVFETMVFAPGRYHRNRPIEGSVETSDALRKQWDGAGGRYSTWEEAEEGHRRIVERLRRDLAI